MNKRGIAYLIMSLTLVGIVTANALVFSNRFRSLEQSSIEVVNNEFTESIISDISGEGLDLFHEVAAKKAIMGALTLYLDFINLFIMLLRLFGQRR